MNGVGRKEKDARVEALRVIACLMVILTHVRPVLLTESGAPADGALLMQSIAAPGVGIFFLIAGFFLPYLSVRRTWKRFLSRILLPALLLVLAVNVSERWLAGESGLFESIMLTDIRDVCSRMLRGLLAFDTNFFGNCAGHLWFLFSYAVLMLWLPLLHALFRANAKKAVGFFVIISILRLLIIDINRLWAFPLQLYLPELPPVEVLYAAAGGLLYQAIENERKQRKDRPYKAFAAGVGILSGVLIFVLFLAQRLLFAKELRLGADPMTLRLNAYFLNWLSGLSVLSALFIITTVLLLPKPKERCAEAICTLGSLTYPVFLLHFPLVYKLQTMGVEAAAKQLLQAGSGVGSIVYSAVYAIFIFCLSAAVWIALRSTGRGILRLLKKYKASGTDGQSVSSD